MSLSSSSSFSSSVAETGARGVYLRRFEQSNYTQGALDGFRVRIEAYGASQMSKYIFRYLRRPYDPSTGVEADECDGVCSSVDMEEYPIGEPTAGQVPPYFRDYFVDFLVRSRAEGNRVWATVVQHVKTLVESLNYAETLGAVEDKKIGDPPAANYGDG